jgi:hypothetical protein
MIDVNANQVDCDKIRKIVINQVNPDNSVSQVIIYFNVDTGDQLTERQAQLCPNIQALEFTCAVVCNPNE